MTFSANDPAAIDLLNAKIEGLQARVAELGNAYADSEEQREHDAEAAEAREAVLARALEKTIKAWETLPGGRRYNAHQIENWLIKDMKPAIDIVRGVLLTTPTLDKERPMTDQPYAAIDLDRARKIVVTMRRFPNVPSDGHEALLVDDLIIEVAALRERVAFLEESNQKHFRHFTETEHQRERAETAEAHVAVLTGALQEIITESECGDMDNPASNAELFMLNIARAALPTAPIQSKDTS